MRIEKLTDIGGILTTYVADNTEGTKNYFVIFWASRD